MHAGIDPWTSGDLILANISFLFGPFPQRLGSFLSIPEVIDPEPAIEGSNEEMEQCGRGLQLSTSGKPPDECPVTCMAALAKAFKFRQDRLLSASVPAHGIIPLCLWHA
jgi:hypothetical protein